MMPARTISLALLLLAACEAHAQGLPPGVGAPAAGGPPPMAPSGPPPQMQQQGGPPCINDFMPLRQEAEKRANVIRAGMQNKDKKMTQPEACAAFRALVTAEGKLVSFVREKSTLCGIPPDAVKQMGANHARTTKMRDQVCNAARPGGPAAAPSLSDALGTSRVPDSTSTQTGRGTLDTLTGGNPLAR